LLADESAEHLAYRCHHGVEVNRSRNKYLPPGEGQDLLGQLRRASACPPDF
jgi:hypothetical protein